ncbi:hypothetical protein [Glaciecola sp. SC05]|uniref:hypothetical protein n=1 Tax=Glaciecola sp. SC05 TaxID=1987355 RepID=UPI0035299364
MTSPSKSFFRYGIAAAIVVTLLLIFFYPHNFTSSMHSNGTTLGRILVDSPEVYTRERMVNDRFHQEAWLLEQLDKLSDENAGFQGTTANTTTSQRSASLTFGTDTVDQAPKQDMANNDAAYPMSESGSPQLSPIESFRGRQSAREEVRNALIENQLDDRHDLGGNTLYRLKFDATIIPGNDTSAWAQINVRFKKGKSDSEDKEQESRDLYQRWMSDLQEQVNTSLDEEAKKVNISDLQLYDFLLKQKGFGVGWVATMEVWRNHLKFDTACEMEVFAESVHSAEGEGKAFEIQSYSPKRLNCLGVIERDEKICGETGCREKVERELAIEKVLDVYGTTLGQKNLVINNDRKQTSDRRQNSSTFDPSVPVFEDTSNLQGPTSGQQFVSFTAASDFNSIIVEEYALRIPFVPYELSDTEFYEDPLTLSAVPIEPTDSERQIFNNYYNRSVNEKDISQEMVKLLQCPNLESVSVYVNNREYRVCQSLINELGPTIVNDLVTKEPNSLDILSKVDFDGLSLFTFKLSDERVFEIWTKRQLACEDIVPVYAAQRKYLICNSNMRELESLSQKEYSQDGVRIIEADIENPTISYSGYSSLAKPQLVAKIGYLKFRDKLQASEKNMSLFSYAVTPRESTQQLVSSSSQAASEQVGASASGSVNGVGAAGGAGSTNFMSQYAQIAERRPIIVGIASHSNENQSNTNIDDSNYEKSAELGWLIGPKLVVGNDGLTKYRHQPSQNSLSAIVSAPSWWRTADIEIETGWLDEEGNFIPSGSTISYPISLPGDQEEITSELLLLGKRPKPSIERIEPMMVKSGEKAKLLIEGQNLWRSTVVTIGAQRSRKIFVLPNMKGIIAEFDAINAQETASSAQGSTSTVRVWTSEGVAEYKDGVVVKASGG